MLNRKMRKAVLIVGTSVATVTIAYVLGVEAGDYLNERKRSQRRIEGPRRAAYTLERMGTVSIGDTLPNFQVEDIDGNWHTLKDLVVDYTVLTFIRPECDGCLLEMEQLQSSALMDVEFKYFLFISTANPLHTAQLRDKYGINSVFLYDNESAITRALNVMSYPFSLHLDRSLVITGVTDTWIDIREVERIISINKAIGTTSGTE